MSGPNGKGSASSAFNSAPISRSSSTRSLAVSSDGLRTCMNGLTATISRSAAQLPSALSTASVRFAITGARSAIVSMSA